MSRPECCTAGQPHPADGADSEPLRTATPRTMDAGDTPTETESMYL
ncbi:MAG TPA: hypothetical protein PKD32_10785 [Saprospiraceae bacterium]|nr:hypothetical protein [Saprospiraceae bacterium]